MNKFVVTCLESQFHVFDARTQHPKQGFASVAEKVPHGATLWRSQVGAAQHPSRAGLKAASLHVAVWGLLRLLRQLAYEASAASVLQHRQECAAQASLWCVLSDARSAQLPTSIEHSCEYWRP